MELLVIIRDYRDLLHVSFSFSFFFSFLHTPAPFVSRGCSETLLIMHKKIILNLLSLSSI